MKATQTGGVLELDIGVEHAHKATLRLEVEDGKARAICRCRAPEAVAEAHKMVDSLRDVLARAGMELGEVDVRFEGGDGDRGDSHREASHENANNQAHTRAERERMREENEGLEVIVSGLVHVIG
jgi:flagellar hook-length control protein FliK